MMKIDWTEAKKSNYYGNTAKSKLKQVTTEIDVTTEYIYNFTVPKNNPEIACLKLDASFLFVATYQMRSEVNCSFSFSIFMSEYIN